MSPIEKIICQMQNTFKRDDVSSAPREVLENLIVSVYDQLLKLKENETD